MIQEFQQTIIQKYSKLHSISLRVLYNLIKAIDVATHCDFNGDRSKYKETIFETKITIKDKQ